MRQNLRGQRGKHRAPQVSNLHAIFGDELVTSFVFPRITAMILV
jgi:hypothetical protein